MEDDHKQRYQVEALKVLEVLEEDRVVEVSHLFGSAAVVALHSRRPTQQILFPHQSVLDGLARRVA
jgi:hypothetical protein